MNNGIKIGLYLLCIVSACVFGYLAYSNYSRLMSQTEEAAARFVDNPTAKTAESRTSGGYSTVLTYGGFFFVSMVFFALLAGHDISHFFGNKALEVLYNEEGKGVANPEYEHAEQEWANGNHLEAVRLMREYLQKNPREQHVAIRIAEIYEGNLNNPLAAALEYEEVLKHKLPPDRWGWAAIHLCNLYLRLNQPEKAVELLRRIDAEYGETAAAEKARKRLAEIGDFDEAIPEEPPEAEEPSRPTGPSLPPGFAPRKG